MKKYDQEFTKEAVKKYLDGQTVASVARELGVNENTIHQWKKKILSQKGESDEANLRLRKRILELEMENEILKKGGGYLQQRWVARYGFISGEKANYPTPILCRVMQVSRSAYYAWEARWQKPLAEKEEQRQAQVKQVFYAHRRRYGSRRITKELQANGAAIERCRTRRVMRELNLKALPTRRFMPKTTNSDH